MAAGGASRARSKSVSWRKKRQVSPPPPPPGVPPPWRKGPGKRHVSVGHESEEEDDVEVIEDEVEEDDEPHLSGEQLEIPQFDIPDEVM